MKLLFFIWMPTQLSTEKHSLTFYHLASASFVISFQICPGLNANEIQILYDKHHKVSSSVKSHQITHNSVKNKVI